MEGKTVDPSNGYDSTGITGRVSDPEALLTILCWYRGMVLTYARNRGLRIDETLR